MFKMRTISSRLVGTGIEEIEGKRRRHVMDDGDSRDIEAGNHGMGDFESSMVLLLLYMVHIILSL